MKALSRVLPWISSRSVRVLWASDSEAFRRVFQRHCRHVETTGFAFDYCDVLADFARRAVEQTDDIAVLRVAVGSLAELGYSYNRWYVRDVLTAVLQAIRETEPPVAAGDGLREAASPPSTSPSPTSPSARCTRCCARGPGLPQPQQGQLTTGQDHSGR